MPRKLEFPTDILDRLSEHRILSGCPRAELQWLVDHGDFRRYDPGEEPWGDRPIESFLVVLSGRMAIYISRGSGRRKFMEWVSGDVSGLLPYSRLGRSPGQAVIEESVEVLEVFRDAFPELIRECPGVTTRLVHVMLDRARHFTSTDLQDEKMMSLGRLAAGLAHELNNPSAAAARSAKLLMETLERGDEAAQAIGAADLSDRERAALLELRSRPAIPWETGSFSTIARSDREDEVAEWLEARGADPESAESLVDSGVTVSDLESFARVFPSSVLGPGLDWIAAGQRARALAVDVERATERIHELVSAVKRFTHMNRATVAEPSDVVGGIADTIRVLGSKMRSKSVSLKADLPAGMPKVQAYGGELNQVWLNLLENALDAVDAGGKIEVRARNEGERVGVSIVDDGPGIPEEIRDRIFDPFFTTKPVGEGTGLGLDIVMRLIRRHDGELELNSRPGRTEFRVSLPASRPGD
jgi:signal transduction histidine kinase